MTSNDNGCINAECREAMRQGRTLDYLAGCRQMDTELPAPLPQLPTVKPVQATTEPDLWRTDKLNGVL